MSIDSHRQRLRQTIAAAAGLAHVAACGGLQVDTGADERKYQDGCSAQTSTRTQNLNERCTADDEADALDAEAADAATKGDAGSRSDGAIEGDASSEADAASEGDAGGEPGTDAAFESDATTTDAGPTCALSCARRCMGAPCTVQIKEGHRWFSCTVTSTVTQNCGRAFDGLLPMRVASRAGLGALLARMAWMEAASITAFRRLARELAHHDAPPDLVHAARKAARDEARHARLMGRLARARGATVPRVEQAPFMIRSLEEVALENAVEACVGETYAAAVAVWQSTHACDPEIRSAMASIAPDELDHAALGHAIADWASGALDAPARERVIAARRAAFARLEADASRATAEEEAMTEAGLPAPSDALRLAAAIARADTASDRDAA